MINTRAPDGANKIFKWRNINDYLKAENQGFKVLCKCEATIILLVI